MMNSENCSALASDVNANTTLKAIDETSQENSGEESFSEAAHEFQELPFFKEDILTVFEIKAELSNKRNQGKKSWKRKRYFGRDKCAHRKQKANTSTLTAVQKRDDAPENAEKDYQEDLDNRSKGNQFIPSKAQEKCDSEIHQAAENLQQTNVISPGFQTNIHNSEKEKLAPEHKAICDSVEQMEIRDSKMKTTEAVERDQTSPENQQNSDCKRRPRPNYFVAIPVTNDQILDLIEDLQEHIFLKAPKLLKALIPSERVHLTILVAHLKGEEEVRRAVSALQQSKEKVEKLLQGETLRLTLHGIGQFKDQVIYIKITENAQELLCRIAEAVTESFMHMGVDISGSKDFNPHLTFLKLTKAPFLRRKGFKRICSDLYKEYEDCCFGTEIFSRIDLCSMQKKNNLSGYYYCESSIIIEAIKPQEVRSSTSKPKEEAYETLKDIEVPTSCSSTSSLGKDADKISSDITDAAAVSKVEGIKENDGQPEAANTLLGEKSYVQSTPDLFPAETMASTAADRGPEIKN
ncbi:A-kinase anchor protein 7-like [Rana temporaria]|uniref:A-kinase anchor protein 7-like n=1 Tax=Rana temporaria TaxID=8407 RepID=UPI001AADFCA7|nr:A-kinase anchor protein 7-like [Rana temporaria]